MNSKLIKIAAVVVVVGIVGYFALRFSIGSAVTVGVNSVGPKITQTRVELAGATISPLTGSGTLTGLFVGNPKGWTSEKAFSCGKVHVALAPLSLLGDHIVVKDVVIEQPEFVYETKLVASNIGDLLKNIQGTASSGSSAATTKSGKPLKFEVKHFLLTGAKVTLGAGLAAVTVPMPPIELTDLGTKEGGITSDQLALAVMRSVSSSVVSGAVQSAGKVGSAAGDAAKQATEGLKGLFGGNR